MNEEVDRSASDSWDSTTTPATYYYDYSSIQSLDFNPLQFSAFAIEANSRLALKIYSTKLFQLCFQSNSNKEILAYFSENVFDKKTDNEVAWLAHLSVEARPIQRPGVGERPGAYC